MAYESKESLKITQETILTDEFMDWEERDTNSISLLKHCVAGSCAGIAEHLTLYPVDTLKTHLQSSSNDLKFSTAARVLYKEEGLLRFWKGANVVASGVIPAHGAQFMLYEYLKEKFDYHNDEQAIFTPMAIGAASTFAHDFFISPSDLIKQRLQLCKKLTARQAIKDLVRQDGLYGLYRSYPLTVFMNIPYSSMVVCVNENLKTYLKPWEKSNPHTWYFLCAGIAGGVAGIITNPLDVIKTRIQTQEVQPSCNKLRKMWKMHSIEQDVARLGKTQADQIRSSVSQIKSSSTGYTNTSSCGFQVKQVHYTSVFQTAQQIFQNEGVKAFGKGIYPRMTINVPSTALSWGTYEMVKGYLINKNEHSSI